MAVSRRQVVDVRESRSTRREYQVVPGDRTYAAHPVRCRRPIVVGASALQVFVAALRDGGASMAPRPSAVQRTADRANGRACGSSSGLGSLLLNSDHDARVKGSPEREVAGSKVDDRLYGHWLTGRSVETLETFRALGIP